VSEKDDPARITVFEIYTDADAYKAHLETPHFRKFRAATERMVTSPQAARRCPGRTGCEGEVRFCGVGKGAFAPRPPSIQIVT
jgi:hypothetical protein